MTKLLISWTISLIKLRNNKGPKTEPCGTPASTSAQLDDWPLMTTHSGNFKGKYALCTLLHHRKNYVKSWARPGFEPGTSRTQSENHTPTSIKRYVISIQIHVIIMSSPVSDIDSSREWNDNSREDTYCQFL